MRASRRSKLPLILAIIWLVLSLLPYVLGESWGMTWFIFNLPLSSLFKSALWRFGKPVYILTVTLLNALIIYGVTYVIISFRRKREP